ncbi:MAG: methyltransferase domain-containing protein [Ruminococcus sp.]|nr:methyltransferase domain-containing protein [Ruminococcus sp.]
MSNIGQFLQNVKEQGGFRAKLRNRLFSAMINGFEAIDADLNEKQAQLDSIRSDMNAMQEVIDSLQKRMDQAETAVGADRETISAIRNDLEGIGTNLRNNNAAIEKLSADGEFVKLKLSGIDRRLGKLSAAAPAENAQSAAAETAAAPAQPADSDYESIDYFDFENNFRGSIESIKKAQAFYLKYFSNKNNVVDIGCGRGEFLSLMKDNGINACGVDIYEPYVEYCNNQELNAVCGDGVAYLAKQDSVDGIFVGQVVEHLQPWQIIRLCNTAYEKLSDGGCIIIETPNPTSLAIYTNAFYIDPSHIKPVHPLTMKYYLEKAGFRDIEIIYTEASRPPYEIPELKLRDGENTEEFNKAMKQVSELLYGSQDYAVVAVKG